MTSIRCEINYTLMDPLPFCSRIIIYTPNYKSSIIHHIISLYYEANQLTLYLPLYFRGLMMMRMYIDVIFSPLIILLIIINYRKSFPCNWSQFLFGLSTLLGYVHAFDTINAQFCCGFFYGYSISQEICTRFFALLCFVVVIHWLIFPYTSGLLHWHCGNLTIAPVPAKQPWWIWVNTSCEFIMNDCITTTKQSTTKPCAYFLGYTVYHISLYIGMNLFSIFVKLASLVRGANVTIVRC